MATIAARLITKGRHVLVCGELENNEWTDKNGQSHTGYQILANKILLLDKKNDASESSIESDPLSVE